MLEIMNLSKSYGKLEAVKGLSLSVPEGSIFGFIGPNGAGKTTTFKIMAGLLKPTSGDVLFQGESLIKSRKHLSETVGYMPDFFGVYDNLKVDEYMDFYAGTYYIPYSERKEIIDNLLELVDLTHKKSSYVDSLSRGMKQRLCLARSLVHDPSILILDEPASGLDPKARVEMKEVLRQLKSLGKTIIISSHILSELSEFCTSVGIVNKGTLVECGTVNDIMRKLAQGKTIYIKPLENKEQLVRLLMEKPNVKNVTENVEDIEFSFDGDSEELWLLIKEIVERDIKIASFKEKEGNLEEIFMQVINGEAEKEAAYA